MTKPKDYVVKPTHGILLPRQVLKISSTFILFNASIWALLVINSIYSVLARQLSKEVLEQAKVCRDKFMIQTITVTLEQLLEEGAVDPRRADPVYVRKSRSCTLDLSHVIPDNVRVAPLPVVGVGGVVVLLLLLPHFLNSFLLRDSLTRCDM